MEETNISNSQPESKEEQSGKIAKNYKATMSKLVAIVGGEKHLFPTKKASKDVVVTIVEGLLKERKENLEKEVKLELIALLDKHVELKKVIAAKAQELKQLEEQKTKEFNEAASKVFNRIESIGDIEKGYYDSINTATT